MEFPGLGDHCQESTCKMLDFLPFKCDSCKKIYCKDHIHYTKHSCDESSLRNKDFQVPLCPLCSQPVPYKRGDLPDRAMSNHIDRDCQSDPAEERRRKIYSNRCFLKGCKQKELIPFNCQRCKKNYCVRHRLEQDHDCFNIMPEVKKESGKDINSKRLQFFQPKQSTAQQQQPRPTQQPSNRINEIQPRSMTEQEALEYAIKLSLNEKQGSTRQQGAQQAAQPAETEDEMLARALALSEQEYQNRTSANSNEKKDACSIN